MATKDERLMSAIHTAAAEFINRESNRTSLITVTKVTMSDDKHAQIFISVFPQKDARAAIDFLSRQHKEFLAFIKKTVKLHFVPNMAFLLDPEMGDFPTVGVGDSQSS